MHYPCSENKGADQLHGYREADLRLCFRICKLLVFSCTGSITCNLEAYQNSVMSGCSQHLLGINHHHYGKFTCVAQGHKPGPIGF